MSNTLEWTLTIDRSPEDVYDYLADFSKHAEWSPKPFTVLAQPDGPLAVGTTLRSSGQLPGSKKAHENVVTITAADRGKRLAFDALEDGQTFVNTFDLAPEGAGTKLQRRLVLPHLGGIKQVALPVLAALVIKPAVQKGLNMLKANLESSASA